MQTQPVKTIDGSFVCPCQCSDCNCGKMLDYMFNASRKGKKLSMTQLMKVNSCIGKCNNPNCISVQMRKMNSFSLQFDTNKTAKAEIEPQIENEEDETPDDDKEEDETTQEIVIVEGSSSETEEEDEEDKASKTGNKKLHIFSEKHSLFEVLSKIEKKDMRLLRIVPEKVLIFQILDHGIHCQNCVRNIKGEFKERAPEVSAVRVDIEKQMVYVFFRENQENKHLSQQIEQKAMEIFRDLEKDAQRVEVSQELCSNSTQESNSSGCCSKSSQSCCCSSKDEKEKEDSTHLVEKKYKVADIEALHSNLEPLYQFQEENAQVLKRLTLDQSNSEIICQYSSENEQITQVEESLKSKISEILPNFELETSVVAKTNSWIRRSLCLTIPSMKCMGCFGNIKFTAQCSFLNFLQCENHELSFIIDSVEPVLPKKRMIFNYCVKKGSQYLIPNFEKELIEKLLNEDGRFTVQTEQISDDYFKKLEKESDFAVKFKVPDMKCGGCVSRITEALCAIEKLSISESDLNLDVESKLMKVKTDISNKDLIFNAISDEGFHPEEIEAEKHQEQSFKKFVFCLSGLDESKKNEIEKILENNQILAEIFGSQRNLEFKLSEETGFFTFCYETHEMQNQMGNEEEELISMKIIRELHENNVNIEKLLEIETKNVPSISEIEEIILSSSKEKFTKTCKNSQGIEKSAKTTSFEIKILPISGESLNSLIPNSIKQALFMDTRLRIFSSEIEIEQNLSVQVPEIQIRLENVIQNANLDIEHEISKIFNEQGFKVLEIQEIGKPKKVIAQQKPQILQKPAPIQKIVKQRTPSKAIATIQLQIEGMSCGACVAKIENYLKSIPGIKECSVNLVLQKGEIRFLKSQISEKKILETMADLGYPADIIKEKKKNSLVLHFNRNSKIFGSRNKKFDKKLSELLKGELMNNYYTKNSIKEVKFSQKTQKQENSSLSVLGKRNPNQITVDFFENSTTKRDIKQFIEEFLSKNSLHPHVTVDFPPKDNQAKEALQRSREKKTWFFMFMFDLIWTVPAMILGMGLTMIPAFMPFFHSKVSEQYLPVSWENFLLFLLSTPVYFIGGWPFFVKSYGALKHKSADMNTLIALAASEAYIYSVLAVLYGMYDPMFLRNSSVFFDAVGALLTFLTIGRYLESLAKGRASSALLKLLDLQPDAALFLKKPTSEQENFKLENLEQQEMNIDLIEKGDYIKVIPGSRIPLDGEVIGDFTSSVDESMLTGESVLVTKGKGDKVYAGTMNKEGVLYVKVTAVGESTTLSGIAKLVAEAQSKKPRIQNIADKISGVFVYFVISVSIITFIVWFSLAYFGVIPEEWLKGNNSFVFALTFCASATIISCPCSLGLAAPAAMIVGSGVAAKKGILVKSGGDVFENAKHIKALLFDKTGTLTDGKLAVQKAIVLENGISISKSEIFNFANISEKNSEHPIGLAITQHCSEYFQREDPDFKSKFELVSFVSVPGKGIKAIFRPSKSKKSNSNENLLEIFIGNEKFMTENKISLEEIEKRSKIPQNPINSYQTSEISDQKSINFVENAEQNTEKHDLSEFLYSQGNTMVYLAIGNQICACFGLRDNIRPEAFEVVEYLTKRMKIAVFMVTGDNARAASVVASQLGIPADHVFSNCTPKDKVSRIKEVQAKININLLNSAGYSQKPKKLRLKKLQKVCFVGDGINDAPVLSTADIGIAMGEGTDIAVESANIVLMRNDLTKIPVALDLSKTVYNRIIINFFWAFFYNMIAIPIAAGALFPFFKIQLPPWVGSIAMVSSSICVLTSSLLLNIYFGPRIKVKSEKKTKEQMMKSKEKLFKSLKLSGEDEEEEINPLIQN